MDTRQHTQNDNIVQKESIGKIINLFDELLSEFREVKEKYIFETSWADSERDEQILNESVTKYEDAKGLILRDIVL